MGSFVVCTGRVRSKVWGLGFRGLGFGFRGCTGRHELQYFSHASWKKAIANLPIVSIVVPFFGFNQFYIQDPKREPQKGTTMETIGRNFLISFLLQQGQSYSSDGTSQKAGILTVTFPSCMLRPRLALSPTP